MVYNTNTSNKFNIRASLFAPGHPSHRAFSVDEVMTSSASTPTPQMYRLTDGTLKIIYLNLFGNKSAQTP